VDRSASTGDHLLKKFGFLEFRASNVVFGPNPSRASRSPACRPATRVERQRHRGRRDGRAPPRPRLPRV